MHIVIESKSRFSIWFYGGGGEKIWTNTVRNNFLLSLQWRDEVLNKKFSCQIMDILSKFAIFTNHFFQLFFLNTSMKSLQIKQNK